METCISVPFSPYRHLFKSYYVVWKPDTGGSTVRNAPVFKSYYVVWKPHYFWIFCDKSCKFKSYYVVWKRYSILILSSTGQRLNRTMQYGNYPLKFLQFHPFPEFKSYYVVWKLLCCLTCTHGTFWFKSYYVVWKLGNTYNSVISNLCLNRTMQYGN